jgi:hypothetical protein
VIEQSFQIDLQVVVMVLKIFVRVCGVGPVIERLLLVRGKVSVQKVRWARRMGLRALRSMKPMDPAGCEVL